MRLQVLCKVLILAIVGLFASFGTTMLLRAVAQQPARKSTPRNAAKKVGEVDITGNAVERPTQPGDEVQPPSGTHIISEGSMPRMEVRMDGRLAHISAQARMRDERPGAAYVWWVRFMGGPNRDKVALQRRYDDQVFSVGVGRTLLPTFDDIIECQIPPGDYRVELTAFLVSDPNQLAVTDASKFQPGPKAWRTVSIK
jgi:hypothetical protein